LDLVRGITALILLLCLVGGAPVLLYLLAGSPLPSTAPTLAGIATALTRPDDGTLLLGALKLIGWAAWASFTAAVLLETASRLRGKHGAPRLPGLGTMQRLAANLITAVAVALASPAASFASAAPPAPAPATATAYLAGDPIPVQLGNITPAAPDAAISADRAGGATELAAPAATFISGMLAGGIVTTLAQLRHRQRQHRRPGHRIKLPDHPRLQHHEHALHQAAEPGTGQRVATALRALAAAIRRDRLPCPDIVGVHLTPTVLEVLLGTPAQHPPAPFHLVPGTDAMVWSLDAAGQAVLEQRADRHAMGDPLPGLLTVGRTHSGGYLLIDVEALGLTACHGPANLVDQLLCHAAIEVATNAWSGWFDVLLVGFPELASLTDRTQHCLEVDTALALLEARAAELAESLAASPAPATVRQRRLRAPHADEWVLTLLISRIPPTPAQWERLSRVTGNHGGVAALVAAAPALARRGTAAFELTAGPAPVMRIAPFGLSVTPSVMAPRTYRDLATLLATAADTTDVPADTPPYRPYTHQTIAPGIEDGSEFTTRPPQAGNGSAQNDVLASPVPAAADQLSSPTTTDSLPGREGCELDILGPVRLLGSRVPLQFKQLELVLALALHPSGLSNTQLATLLGSDPDHPRPQESLRQLITRTRRALGPTAHGGEHITYATKTKLYQLGDVALDWALFRTLTARAAQDDPGVVPGLRAALALIRGRPLDGVYLWWIEIPVLESIRADIVDAAESLAERELRADRPQWAAKAARTGLSADLTAEQLWRCLMRAEYDLGNLAGVHEAWTTCLEAISEVSLEGEPHPATARLYHQLTTGGHTTRTANELARFHP
jgi:DNA-binding SARP family transcriptional activator